MRTAVDYAARAAECRRLATQHTTKPEHWGAFLEMAETWEMLLRHQQERSRWQTIALADRCRNVLFLSDHLEAETAAKADNNENQKAA